MVFTYLPAENNVEQSGFKHGVWIQGERGWKHRNYSDKSFCEMWKKLLTLFWLNINPTVSIYCSCWALGNFCPFHLPASLELLSQSALLVTPLEAISLNRGVVVLLPSYSLPGRIVFLNTMQQSSHWRWKYWWCGGDLDHGKFPQTNK